MSLKGLVVIFYFVNIELESITATTLISPDVIKFPLPCGTRGSTCEWPKEYCLENDVCRYCSAEICRNPPDQCKFLCEFLRSRNQTQKEMAMTAVKCGLRENEVFDYNTLLILFCIASAVCVILLVLLTLVCLLCRERLLEFVQNKKLNRKGDRLVVSSSEPDKQTTALLISGRTQPYRDDADNNNSADARTQ